MGRAKSDFQILPTDSEVIADLPQDMRRVLAMSDQPYSDIAATLSVPIGTVKSRLNRARAKIVEFRKQTESAQENAGAA